MNTTAHESHVSNAQRRSELVERHQLMWMHILYNCCTWQAARAPAIGEDAMTAATDIIFMPNMRFIMGV